MTILLATDSFKDALPATAVAQALERGIQLANPAINVRSVPLADGGEGTAELLTRQLGGLWLPVQTQDPLFRPVTTHFGYLPDRKLAILDMAQASGLQLLEPSARNPLQTGAYGTGLLIQKVLELGARKILLGIGGSATNDAGMGVARALGWKFLDSKGGELLGRGADLAQVETIVPGPPIDCEITVLCDVTNPLFGPNGAAHVYAPQKGTDAATVADLDAGLRRFADCCERQLDRNPADRPGAGAAGGLGYGALLFLGAELRSGIDTVMDVLELEQAVAAADLVITGEGRLDAQSMQGKLISGVCRLAERHRKPVVAVCGTLELCPEEIKNLYLTAAFSIQTRPVSLEEALRNTAAGLEHLGFQLASIYK